MGAEVVSEKAGEGLWQEIHSRREGKQGSLPVEVWPPRPQRRSSLVERMYNELMDYLEAEKRTAEEEYNLVLEKKSRLSRRLREFLYFVVEFEKGKKLENGEGDRA